MALSSYTESAASCSGVGSRSAGSARRGLVGGPVESSPRWSRTWWRSGAFTFAVGFTLGGAQILTQPTGLVRDLARYRAGEID